MIMGLITGFLQKHIFKIVGGIGIILIILSAVVYYNWSQKEIKTLRNNQAVLEVAVEQQQKTIISMERDFEQATDLLKQIVKNNDRYSKEIIDLINKFTKRGRSIEDLAHSKPELVQKIINDATDKALRCTEAISRGEQCTD